MCVWFLVWVVTLSGVLSELLLFHAEMWSYIIWQVLSTSRWLIASSTHVPSLNVMVTLGVLRYNYMSTLVSTPNCLFALKDLKTTSILRCHLAGKTGAIVTFVTALVWPKLLLKVCTLTYMYLWDIAMNLTQLVYHHNPCIMQHIRLTLWDNGFEAYNVNYFRQEEVTLNSVKDFFN